MKRLLVCLILIFSLGPLSFAEGPSVQYQLSLDRHAEHFVDVRMQVSGLHEENIQVALPAWNNLYQIRDFARFVRTLHVKGPEGQELQHRRVDKQTWSIKTGGLAEVTISYSVFANQPGSFSSEVNDRHAFIHPALVCLYLPSHREVPHALQFANLKPGWKVATGLDLKDGAYRADSYDHLIDCPFEVSDFESISFSHAGATYQIVVDDRQDSFAMEDLEKIVRRVVVYQVGLMRRVPFDRFVFIYHIGERGGGGMEHRNSTVMGLSRSRVELDITSAAGLTAHEFFHLWNVKQIRPSAFDEMDLSRETYTPSLWFAEGTTSYYGLLTLVRTGLIDAKTFYGRLVDQMHRLQSRSGRLIQSLQQSSLETWFDKYPYYRLPDNSISYYNKGSLVSLLLDLRIRHVTENRRSLDDVIRLMNVWFGERNKGFDESDIQRAVESLTQMSFEDFFSAYVEGTEELPYEEYFHYAGLEVYEEVSEKVELSFSLDTEEDGTPRIKGLAIESPAWRAGLREGDRLLRVNQRRESVGDELVRLEPGREIALEIERGAEQLTVRFYPETRLEGIVDLSEATEASSLQLAVRNGLMTGNP